MTSDLTHTNSNFDCMGSLRKCLWNLKFIDHDGKFHKLTSTLRKVQQELRSPLRVWRLLCSLSPADVIQMAGCCQSRRVYVPQRRLCVCVCLVQGCAGHSFGVLLSALITVGVSAFRTADKSWGAIEEKRSTHSTACLIYTYFFPLSSFTVGFF